MKKTVMRKVLVRKVTDSFISLSTADRVYAFQEADIENATLFKTDDEIDKVLAGVVFDFDLEGNGDDFEFRDVKVTYEARE